MQKHYEKYNHFNEYMTTEQAKTNLFKHISAGDEANPMVKSEVKSQDEDLEIGQFVKPNMAKAKASVVESPKIIPNSQFTESSILQDLPEGLLQQKTFQSHHQSVDIVPDEMILADIDTDSLTKMKD